MEKYQTPKGGMKIHRNTEIISMFIPGFTTMNRNRDKRRIYLQKDASITTLIHEAMHFFVHNKFVKVAETVKNEGYLKKELGIEHTLMEGFPEFFCARIMVNHPDKFGKYDKEETGYEWQEKQIWRYRLTIGFPSTRDAYFKGDKASLNKLKQALSEYKKIADDDLIVPSFVLS